MTPAPSRVEEAGGGDNPLRWDVIADELAQQREEKDPSAHC